jgi:hypothetical protein
VSNDMPSAGPLTIVSVSVSNSYASASTRDNPS